VVLLSIAPTVLAYKLLYWSGPRGWARRLETPALGRLRCQQEDPSGGHRLPWGVPLQTSDTSGPLRGSNPSVCQVSGPCGHRGNLTVTAWPASGGVRPMRAQGQPAAGARSHPEERPAHAGTGATAAIPSPTRAVTSGPCGHRGNQQSAVVGDNDPRPAHAGTGATSLRRLSGRGGYVRPTRAQGQLTVLRMRWRLPSSGPRGHRGNNAPMGLHRNQSSPAHAGTGATVRRPGPLVLRLVRPTRAQAPSGSGNPCRPRLRAPHHPPNPGQPAAGVRQIGRPGARPGPGLGAIGQHGRQQIGQIIGRGGHRRGRGGGAAAGFPQADRLTAAIRRPPRVRVSGVCRRCQTGLKTQPTDQDRGGMEGTSRHSASASESSFLTLILKNHTVPSLQSAQSPPTGLPEDVDMVFGLGLTAVI
jgi:hypothetical protein